jgi:hypothetical protein
VDVRFIAYNMNPDNTSMWSGSLQRCCCSCCRDSCCRLYTAHPRMKRCVCVFMCARCTRHPRGVKQPRTRWMAGGGSPRASSPRRPLASNIPTDDVGPAGPCSPQPQLALGRVHGSPVAAIVGRASISPRARLHGTLSRAGSVGEVRGAKASSCMSHGLLCRKAKRPRCARSHVGLHRSSHPCSPLITSCRSTCACRLLLDHRHAARAMVGTCTRVPWHGPS